MRALVKTALLIAIVAAAVAMPARAERIKDIVDIQGVRSNPLWGYGLVIGLNGTGDNSETSRRALANLLRRSGLVLNPAEVASKNIASVLVTAELGPFARHGSTIDVMVSAIGDAGSLAGGTLLMTPLTAADGAVYSVAQGQVTIGGFSAAGESASVSKNHTTVGRIANGATVEREEIATFIECGQLVLQLKNADFTTADRIARTINGSYAGAAVADDAGTVRVTIPGNITRADVPQFISAMGALDVEVDMPAIVVINERTGTIIVGENVRISTMAISRGNLSIVTQEKEFISQANPLASGGKTEKVNRTGLEVTEETGAVRVVTRTVSVADLARALNAMGLTARDLISIFEDMRKAGALQATLKVI